MSPKLGPHRGPDVVTSFGQEKNNPNCFISILVPVFSIWSQNSWFFMSTGVPPLVRVTNDVPTLQPAPNLDPPTYLGSIHLLLRSTLEIHICITVMSRVYSLCCLKVHVKLILTYTGPWQWQYYALVQCNARQRTTQGSYLWAQPSGVAPPPDHPLCG